MKKSLLALAALTAFAGVASAQSSVTLFGVIDANMRNVKNGSNSLRTLSTDGMGSSRLGLRGVEDIGGGLRASFWLEGSVNVDVGGGQKTAAVGANGNGSGGQDWQRRATVSLAGGFGEIRLGRDYTPDFWNHTVFDPFGTNGVGSSTNLFGAFAAGGAPANIPATTGSPAAPNPAFTAYPTAGTVVRANNSVGYFLPGGLGGVYGQVMLSAGERANGNKHTGFRIGYAAGPVNVAFAYGKTGVAEGPTIDWTRMNLAGSYNLGFMTLMAQYIKADVSGGFADGREVTNYVLGANIKAGAAGTLKVSYVSTDGDGRSAVERATDATQLAFGYQHALSKRTSLYAHYSRISNKAEANFTASSGGVAFGTTRGRDSNGYEFGINHSF
jgi:predicted porin